MMIKKLGVITCNIERFNLFAVLIILQSNPQSKRRIWHLHGTCISTTYTGFVAIPEV